MKRILFSLIIVLTASIIVAHSLELTKGKRSLSTIHIAPDASPDVVHAANELQRLIYLSTGATIEISTTPPKNNAKFISMANCTATDKLIHGGFSIRVVDDRRLEFRGAGRGIVYSVYDFAELLGFRLYATDATIVPSLERIMLTADFTRKWEPVFTFRNTLYTPSNDQLYIDWHRQNHDTLGQNPDWGLWVHTYFKLCPPDQYFQTNPEYFALRDGNRVATQLCLSNFDVLTIVTENLEKLMAQKPEAKYWSVSPEDNFGYCQCEECSAMDKQDGSPTGSVVQFADKIAQAFPHKIISTLAYQYSRAAPTTTLPSENLNIMLCNIECNRNLAIIDDPTSQSFVDDMTQWSSLTSNILVWDYIIQFKNLVSPFPNFHTLAPNLRFFAQNKVQAIFEQGNRESGGEFEALRCYLICKLLIDPTMNTDYLIADFCNGYYGQAAEYIVGYIKAMTNNLLLSGAELKIFGSPCDQSAVSTWLSAENLDSYQSFFDRAEQVVAHNPTLLKRVQFARQPLYYAELEQAKLDPYGQRGMFVRQFDGGWKTNPVFANKLTLFVERCRQQGVSRLSEWHTTADEYLVLMRNASTIESEGVLSFRSKYTLPTPPHSRYCRNAESVLTDGVLGTNDYNVAWIGYDQPTFSVIIELGAAKSVNRVSAHFMQQLTDWIFLPSCVNLSLSDDGHNFKPAGSIQHSIDRQATTASKWLDIELDQAHSARYVKLDVTGVGTCPDWHLGAGGKAFTFIDQINVY